MAQLDVNLNQVSPLRDNLYHLALQCEENKKNGCRGNCGACQFNVVLYTESIRDAALIKTTAMIDAHKQYEYQQNQLATSLGAFILIGIVILCIMFTCNTPKKPVGMVAQAVEQIEPPTKVKVKNINTVLRQTRMNLRDINNDGKINCIDYATIFYMKYGDGAHIIVNRSNPASDMNHLFNAIDTTDGGLMYVEPQARAGIESYDPAQYWGADYNPAYNKDVTQFYKP
jgi:hypothetical protein